MSRGLWNTAAQFVERGYAAKAPWYFNIPLLSSRGGTTGITSGWAAVWCRCRPDTQKCSGLFPHGAPQTPCRKLQGVFLLPLKKAGASAHFSGNTRYRYDGGQCPPPTDKPEAAFWRGVSAGWGTPPYVLKGSLWGMSDIYRAKNGQRASGMSIKFQKFRDSSAKNSK